MAPVQVATAVEIEDEILTPEEETAIREYEEDKRNGVALTYSLEEVRRRLGLDR